MENAEPQSVNNSRSPNNNSTDDAASLNSDQAAQLNAQLSSLDKTLEGAVEKFALLHEPLKSHGDADLYKQPESNLLAYVRQLTASATSNVLDILESLPVIMDEARDKNLKLLETLGEDQSSDKISGRIAEISDHLTKQNEMMHSISMAHGDILSLHSFQDLASQAVIRAESFADEIKHELEDAHQSLLVIRGLDKDDKSTLSPANAEAASDCSQLDQSDVDSLFASIKN